MAYPTTGNIVAIASVMVAYILFAIPMLLRRRPSTTAGAVLAKRDLISIFGILFQGIAFGIVFFGSLRVSAPSEIDAGVVIEAAPAAFLAFGSVLLFWLAFLTLGANWSLVAQTSDDHQLVTRGPYAWVRNPIYLAMLMMLVAAALALGRTPVLVAAIPLFFIGTLIRVLREERLLRSQFGDAYDAYAAKVSRLLPGLW